MRVLDIDIETFSPTDLLKSGVYRYAEDPGFKVLLFAYSIDGGEVKIIDLTAEPLPDDIKTSLLAPDVIKSAWNANFERMCLSRHLGVQLPPEQWHCTMVAAARAGWPLSLDAAAKAMRLPHLKDTAGKALIRYFSIPCKPTNINGHRLRNLPEHAPEKWERYKEYCIQDVVVEQAISARLHNDVTNFEKELWELDQKINDRGIMCDIELVDNAIDLDTRSTAKLTSQATKITRLDNPNSVAQLKAWVEAKTGEVVESLTKASIPEIISATNDSEVIQALQLRQELAKTSVKKYEAMYNSICADGRIRGLLQFYGANRTGRWAGRLVQFQNLPQNHINDLELAREIVRRGELELFEMLWGSVPDTLSQLIRTAFIAPVGHTFCIADFSAIEARVIAWLAGEQWRLDVFNSHGKIYEASASHMFKVPIEDIAKGSELRQRGKVAELALGYQGGPGALISMGALKQGLKEAELPALVKAWRLANPMIVRLWRTLEDEVSECLQSGKSTRLPKGMKAKFLGLTKDLIITLPSGRDLTYTNARLDRGKIMYDGMNQTTKQWAKSDTYGGKLAENIVQAIARDCLAEALVKVDDAGFKIVMHVHDEIVVEVEDHDGKEQERSDHIARLMGGAISWAPGLPLRADCDLSKFYRK